MDQGCAHSEWIVSPQPSLETHSNMPGGCHLGDHRSYHFGNVNHHTA